MKKITYSEKINAPAEKVFKTMLGIEDKKTYESWTSEFNPTSTYEGRWEKNSKMYFVGMDDKGKKGGMVSEIADIRPHSFVSIRHYGLLDGDKEVTEGPEVESWAGGLENYSFEEKDGVTTVNVEMDTAEDHQEYFDQTWPKALNKLKSLVEK